jgi:hypothetical protein
MHPSALWISQNSLRGTDERRRWFERLFEKAHPVLTDLEWKPCLQLIDGRPLRSGALVVGLRGSPTSQER